MSIWHQGLLAFAVMLLIMGYFQYRRSGDVLSIIQEMFRPAYLLPAVTIAIIYMILAVLIPFLGKIL